MAEVARLARCEREATASLIAHLAELYGRRLHERAGYSSLFAYCTGVLRLSEHEAYDRMRAAKVARRYPAVLELLATGHVNLTTVRLLAPHLTRQNHDELFAAVSGKRKRQVQELLAQRFPQPDVASSIRRLPAQRSVAIALAAETPASPVLAASMRAAPVPPPMLASAPDVPARPPIPAPPRPLVQPLAPDRYRITFTASGGTCEMLELAQDLLRHAIPSGDPAQIVARALEVLVEDLVRRKYAATPRPRGSQGQRDDSRNIPAEVRRAVFLRDRGRCAFIGSDGRRCGERAFVQFHHLVPYAAGGKPTVDNMALRSRTHGRIAHRGRIQEGVQAQAGRHRPGARRAQDCPPVEAQAGRGIAAQPMSKASKPKRLNRSRWRRRIDIVSLGQTVTSGHPPCRPLSHPLARAAADIDISDVPPAAWLAGAASGSDRRLTPQPPEAALPLMLARDPQQCADIVLSFLMRIHGARAGAIFAVDAPPTNERAQLFVGNGIDQRALEWTAASWSGEQRSLEQGRMSRHDERFLLPILRGRELAALLYLTTTQVDLGSVDEVAGLISDAVLRGGRQPRVTSPVEVYLERTPSKEIERRRMLMLLERHEWNLARVARELRVTRTTVYKRLQAFAITRKRV